jgi:molybdopterin/thiamine biosynthesis adenylyltransferase/rhodanese-related sulfurtransferase
MKEDWIRYSCQIALPGFGEENQKALSSSKILIIGMGGIGCPAAQYLTASGIGTIGIVDDDIVSLKNLHRQILYTEKDEGVKKVVQASKKLKELNPAVTIVPHDVYVNDENVLSLIDEYDIILDATDNFETRYLINDACVLRGKPLIYSAIYQYEGQVAVWNFRNDDGTMSPNYRDVYPEIDPSTIPNCSEGGVIPTLAGLIGCIAANETIKLITKSKEVLAGQLMLFNIQTLQSRIINICKTSQASIKQLKPTVKVETISVDEFQDGIENNSYQIVDVRSVEERKERSLGGVHIPMELLQQELTKINNDKPIVFYCASGLRSKEAVKIYKRIRPEGKAFSLEGGINSAAKLHFQG